MTQPPTVTGHTWFDEDYGSRRHRHRVNSNGKFVAVVLHFSASNYEYKKDRYMSLDAAKAACEADFPTSIATEVENTETQVNEYEPDPLPTAIVVDLSRRHIGEGPWYHTIKCETMGPLQYGTKLYLSSSVKGNNVKEFENVNAPANLLPPTGSESLKPMERIVPEMGIRLVVNSCGEHKGFQQAWRITPVVNNPTGESTIEWRPIPAVIIHDITGTGFNGFIADIQD